MNKNFEKVKTVNIFPRKINRQVLKPFIIHDNLLNIIFEFLSYDDAVKISTLNVQFYNNFVAKQQTWKNAIIPLSRKFCFKYTYNKEKDEIEEFGKDGIFEMDVGHKGNYIQFKDGYITYYSILYYYDWKNKDNPKEWAMHKVTPIFGGSRLGN